MTDDACRARIRTTHDQAGTVAAALRPDNTDAMDTRVAGSTVITTMERETTGGLRTTIDDYVSNLAVAERTITNTNYE